MTRTAVTVCALVWTLLLVAIAVELRRIDDSLYHLSLPNRNLGRMVRTPAVAGPPETREQRIARKRQEMKELQESIEESFEAAGISAPKGKTATASPAPR